MRTHKMIVKTQGRDAAGKATSSTEHVRHIPTADLDARREAARHSAPAAPPGRSRSSTSTEDREAPAQVGAGASCVIAA